MCTRVQQLFELKDVLFMTSDKPASAQPPIDERLHPLAFVATEGTDDVPHEGERLESTLRCEVVGSEGRFLKEGLVEDLSTGRAWRLLADEGKYLRGTGLAPAPLMHWAAGLHGDVTARIAGLAAAEHVQLRGLDVTMSQGFASQGSFAKGEAVGLVFDLVWEISVVTDHPASVVESIVSRALHSSPAHAAMTSAHHGTFALYANGRTIAVPSVPQAPADVLADPLRRHSASPVPVDGDVDSTAILTERPGTSGTLVAGDDHGGAIGWHVQADGHFDVGSGTVTATIGFPELASAETWALVSDPTNRVAPSPLSYFSLGTAFCFHTQLCRYVDVRRLPITSPRLAQTSMFTTGEGAAGTQPFETHLFLNGSITEDGASSLLTAAANTCYAHRALSVDVACTHTTRARASFEV